MIQDDPADWEAVAEKMGRIYHKSSLNISAVVATSAKTGCFPDFAKERNWHFFIGRMHCDPQTPKHPPQADRLYAEVVFPVEKHPKNSFRPCGPLNSRGWVLQEEVFSSRLLSFCQEGIFWECLKTNASERMPEGEPAGDFSVDRNSLKFYARNFKTCLLEAQQVWEIRATFCCLALFPTQNCFLVSPSSKVAEFRRVGLGIWPLASWNKLLGGSEGLGGLGKECANNRGNSVGR
jgi:hypothetical protein